MNYVCLFLEMVLIYLLMIIFYRIDKKDSLYLYMGLMSSVLCFALLGTIEVISFNVNMGIPVIMGIFISSNVIVHRYGVDEVKRILCTFGVCYFVTSMFMILFSCMNRYGLDIGSSSISDLLFRLDLSNIRIMVGGFISILSMLWIGSGIYYSVRKNRNVFVMSNMISSLVVAFIESMIFVFMVHLGSFKLIELFGMISVRYLLEIILGFMGLIPTYILIKIIDK